MNWAAFCDDQILHNLTRNWSRWRWTLISVKQTRRVYRLLFSTYMISIFKLSEKLNLAVYFQQFSSPFYFCVICIGEDDLRLWQTHNNSLCKSVELNTHLHSSIMFTPPPPPQQLLLQNTFFLKLYYSRVLSRSWNAYYLCSIDLSVFIRSTVFT